MKDKLAANRTITVIIRLPPSAAAELARQSIAAAVSHDELARGLLVRLLNRQRDLRSKGGGGDV